MNPLHLSGKHRPASVRLAMCHNRGVTLIELMVTLSILAIVLAMALPSFGQLMAEHKIKTVSQTLVSALNLARSEAIKRGHEVSVCPLAAGNGTRACLNNGWQAAMGNEAGLWVFDDLSRPLLQLENPDQLIRHLAPGKAGISITASAGLQSGISYLADGSAKQAGTLKIALPDAVRCLKLAANGRLTLKTGTHNAPC